MPDAELRDLGKLAGEVADETVISMVQGMHDGISGRVFKAIGPGAEPVRVVHDRISAAGYGALRRAAAGLGPLSAGLSRFVGGEEEVRSVSASRVGRATQGAINGLIGDRLEREGSELRIEMAVRKPGRDIAVEEVGDEFEGATGRIAVFLHGLCETEEGWWLGTRADPATDAPAPATYGQRLREELGFTPVYVRYNTGLHVPENGRKLSSLLEQVRREWPVPVEEIALVGHSMGGLVARSACHEAADAERAWLGDVRHLVCLAAPNNGSWLEKFVNVGGAALKRLPETRPFADFLELRSAGIRDLRYGYVSELEWEAFDPDEVLRNRAQPLAPVPGVSYHFASAALANPGLAWLIGDLLVGPASARGPLGPDGAPSGDDHHFPGLVHFHLLNHPLVYERIHEWLEPAPAEAGAPVSLCA